jgi:hypothetical protein
MKQLSIAQCSGYPTYLNTSYAGEENLADHKSFISSLDILFSKEHDDISCLYWIAKFHTNLNRGNTTTGAYSFSRQPKSPSSNVAGFTMIAVIPQFNLCS